jgi:hypothetical protein
MAEPPKNDFVQEKMVLTPSMTPFFSVQNHFWGVLPSGKTQNLLEPKKVMSTFFFFRDTILMMSSY